MEPNLESYYDTYNDLFITDGWKQFVEDFTEKAVIINSVEATNDGDDLHFRKGQLNIIASMVHLQDLVDYARTEAENADST